MASQERPQGRQGQGAEQGPEWRFGTQGRVGSVGEKQGEGRIMNELERLKRIEAAARALVDAINADDNVDITPQVNALAEALEAKP